MNESRISALMDAVEADYVDRPDDETALDLLGARLGVSDDDVVRLVEAIGVALAEDSEHERIAFALLTGANLALKVERANELERWTDA